VAELRCRGVGKAYGARLVLSGVDLHVPEGTLTAILGASGSGKTTLLRLIIGFIAPDEGRIEVGGAVVAEAGAQHLPPERRAVGYVAQEGALYPHLDVAGNVGFGLPRAERKAGRRIDEMLDLVGLGRDYAGRLPHELSGGEQRRVALARALAPRPRLVLLDEPFSGLDAALRVETREAVLHALAEEGSTAVLVTHDQAEALSMGREVAVLRDGRLVQTATPSDLYAAPADLDVARFVGEAVVIPGQAAHGLVRCALGTLTIADGGAEGAVHVVIRPEQIDIHPLPGGPIPNGAVTDDCGTKLRCRVTGVTYYGPETLVRLTPVGTDPDEGAATDAPVVTAKVFSHRAPRVGELVGLEVSGPVSVYGSGAAGGVEDGRDG
jgi:iron(III) transport system ATP-binding protein